MKYVAIASLILSLQPFLAFAKEKGQVMEIQVTEKGFEPEKIDAKPGVPIILKVTRKTDATCAKQIKVLSLKIKKDLPLNKTVSIDLGTLEKGNIAFACGMDMMTGHIGYQGAWTLRTQPLPCVPESKFLVNRLSGSDLTPKIVPVSVGAFFAFIAPKSL
jgi:plastocyanin domain-containing protein